MSVNIPLGTYVQDGIRVGPSYSGYNKYGPGLLCSPQTTWRIVPYPSTDGNICTATSVTGASYLTLGLGDTNATTLLTGADGNKYIQFDWPRVPGVRLIGPSLTSAPVSVTIFGTDWYGFPLQHTYTVLDSGNGGYYPASDLTGIGIAEPSYNFGAACKAFYTVTKVYVNGVIPSPTTIQVETTNIFGLPYKLASFSNILDFDWDGMDMLDQTGTVKLASGFATVNTPATTASANGNNIFVSHGELIGTAGILSIGTPVHPTQFVINTNNDLDVSYVNWLIKNGGDDITNIGDSSTPTAGTTYDVRGLVQLPGTGEMWAAVPDGVTPLVFTYYVVGSDQFQNQLAAAGQPQGSGFVNPLTASDLYGVPQYYTGVPA
jgi:hypothetical protein